MYSRDQTVDCHNQETCQSLTKVFHTLLVCIIQEKVSLFDSPVNFKTKTQTGIFHQVRQDLLSKALWVKARHMQALKRLNHIVKFRKINIALTGHSWENQ